MIVVIKYVQIVLTKYIIIIKNTYLKFLIIIIYFAHKVININDINFQIRSSKIDLKSPQKMEINKELKITKLNSSSKKKGDGYL